MLTRVPYADSIGKRMQTAFYGLNHTPACADGEIYDCGNLTSEYFPLMAPRKKRGLLGTLTKPNGLGGRDALCYVDGTEFFYNGEKKGNVSDSRKSFYYIGPYIIIWPDKAYYHTVKDEFGSLEETYVSGAGDISFADGTYAGEAAEKNCIVTSGAAFNFEVGDAVTISGCSVEANNTTPIIREISDDRKTLRFYENTFTIASGSSYTEQVAVTIKRAVPDMDYLCECNNRLWGCKGDDIYCCNLGNPKVWNDFEGLATGSWAVSVGSAGDFTGCFAFLGYPGFFKEDIIHKVYGSKPSDFSVDDGTRTGLLSGCERSFAVAGDTLFYHARAGIVRYSGGYAYSAGDLGRYTLHDCAGGSDGRRYYISGLDEDGNAVMLTFDTRTKLWLREDCTRVMDFAYADGLYFLTNYGEIWRIENDAATTEEENLESLAEFGDFYEGSPDRKRLNAIQIRTELETGAELTVKISFNGGDFETIGTISNTGKKMYKLSIVPRRCDYWRLRIEGVGDWKIYAIAREFSQGSDQN